MRDTPPMPGCSAAEDGRPRRPLCRQHAVTAEFYVPQLLRLLRGAPRERNIYYSMVDDVVGANNPLELFKRSEQRSGMCFIESLYRAHSQQVDSGDELMQPSLAPLGYSRWVAWRRFANAVRDGSVQFSDSVDLYIVRSRDAVNDHLREGWRPEVVPDDPELHALLNRGFDA